MSVLPRSHFKSNTPAIPIFTPRPMGVRWRICRIAPEGEEYSGDYPHRGVAMQACVALAAATGGTALA